MSGEITLLLAELSRGNQAVADELFVEVYQELRQLAKSYMAQERDGHTLQPTALVHEAYLRLLGSAGTQWRDRAHFFRTAGQVMRRVLVDYARASAADKRGGDGQKIPLDETNVLVAPGQNIDLILLDELLTELQRLHPRASQLVELRYFIGLSDQEAAEVLEVSQSTLKREWKFARAWLLSRMNGSTQEA
ncbi:MAG: sigma-70 family RNA polymerase sigma factor [Blastocatellia bacterium]